MIATLRGHVLSIAADSCIIEVQGVGYQVFMPLSALDELRRLSGEVLIHTYQYVREDTLALYGFLRPEDKNLFTQVIGVSGIGPKPAWPCSRPFRRIGSEMRSGWKMPSCWHQCPGLASKPPNA